MTESQTPKTKHTRTLQGIVVSTAMDKTVTVLVDRYIKHPKYRKYQKQSKRYKAHDEDNTYQKGDWVSIEECRPLSRDKTFRVVGRVAR